MVETLAKILEKVLTKTFAMYLTYVDVRPRLSTYVDVRGRTSTYVDVRRRRTTYVDIRRRTLTYVDACRRSLPRRRMSMSTDVDETFFSIYFCHRQYNDQGTDDSLPDASGHGKWQTADRYTNGIFGPLIMVGPYETT